MNLKNAKRITVTFVVSIVTVFSVLFTFAAEGGAGSVLYESIMDLGDGFSYSDTMLSASSGREESYQMSSTPQNSVKPIVLSSDAIHSCMTITNVISYAAQLGYNVVGAINTDFFAMSTGVPLGIVVENGIYKSSPSGYPSVCFDADGNASITDYTAVLITIMNEGGAPAAEDGSTNEGKNLSLTNYNKIRQNGAGMYLLNEYFGGSTATSSAGWFVQFRVLEGDMKTNGSVRMQVVDVYESSTAYAIEPGYMYLTADNTSNLAYQYQKFAVGDVVLLETSTYGNEALADCMWATGGGTVLIRDGAVTDSSEWDSTVTGRNPRSALGIRADGTVMYYVIDGRNTSHSTGLTMSQLANELLAQGCVSAINFDGGGSTAMSVRLPDNYTAQLVNSPSEGSLRKCSTYILLVADAESDGVPRNLSLNEQGAVVYQGASLPLSFAATDAGHSPAAGVPEDITASVSAGYGSVEDNVYTAGWVPGTEIISMNSPSYGASGEGSLYVVSTLDDISVTVNGSAVSSLNVAKGDVIQFSQTASYNGKYVVIDQDSFEYTFSGDFASVSDTGVLTVDEDALGGTGYLTIAAGGVVETITVSMASVFSDISGHWAEAAIVNLYDRGIVTGSAGRFNPDSSIKRGDFILMLYRAAGQPEASPVSGFSDVSASDYYASAVSWAKETGIAQGDGVSFKPGSSLKREEAFTFIYRYLRQQGGDMEDADSSALDAFADALDVSEYAVTPVATLIETGLVDGSGGLLNPSGLITRAQMAKILSATLEL